MPGACVTPQGNCTYFPFFSDFKGQNRVALSALETAVLSCIFLGSLLVNVCAISALARKKKLLTANCLVLNLFCVDLLFISAIPLILVVRWTESWVLGDVVCHMLLYVISLSGSVTILSLAAVSLERMVCIVRLRHTARCSGKLLAGTLLLIWGLAALANLPLCLFFQVEPLPMNGEEVQICTLVWPSVAGEISWDITFTFVVFVIPGLVIVISYTKILQDYKSIKKKIKCQFSLLRNASDSSLPTRLQTISNFVCADDLFLHHVESNYHHCSLNFSSELQTGFENFAIIFLLDNGIHFCQLCRQSSFV
ncbi:unnamed protein product [Caretta caretta]